MSSYYEKFLATGEVKCIDEEIPYSLPFGWTWCRLNELGTYRKGPFGSTLTKSMFVPKGEHSVKVYEQKNAIQKDYSLGEYYITEDKFSEMQSFLAKPSDIIVSCAGTIGETYLLPEEAPIGIINQALMRVELYNLDIADYWQLFFAYILLIENKMKGAGSAIKNIPPFEYLKAILVPIPPLKEQKRIIEKYNELTKLICQYTQQKEELDSLNDNLYPNIKKSILQEAIQGRLVSQDSSDGSANDLFQHIKEEKQRLVKEGKLKKSALSDSVIYKSDDNKYYENDGNNVICIDDEIPFEIPSSWQWCRLRNISSIKGGKRIPVGDKLCINDTGHKYIRVADMKNQTIKEDDIHYISDSTYEKIKAYTISSDDLYITVAGTIGNVGEVPDVFNNANLTENANKIVTYKMNNKYLMYCLLSGSVQSQIRNCTTKVGQPKLAIVRIENLLIPVPPLAEQQRISEKIKEAYKLIGM